MHCNKLVPKHTAYGKWFVAAMASQLDSQSPLALYKKGLIENTGSHCDCFTVLVTCKDNMNNSADHEQRKENLSRNIGLI